MQLSWEKIRDPETCELYHVMWDPIISKEVASIHKVKFKKPYQVKILDRVPWHRKTLKQAKADCEWIYGNTK